MTEHQVHKEIASGFRETFHQAVIDIKNIIQSRFGRNEFIEFHRCLGIDQRVSFCLGAIAGAVTITVMFDACQNVGTLQE